MQKLFSGGAKEWLLIVFGAAALLAALFFPMRYALADVWTEEEQQLADAYHKNELIRIHIIANSDSPKDQELKLKVRDTLIDAFGNLLQQVGTQTSDAVYLFLQQHTDQMLAAAQECCTQNGFSGNVTAETGLLRLPSKQYGKVFLPEGEYRALRITLGDGNGQNWWCVLYPQLCIALAGEETSATDELLWRSKQIFAHWLLMVQ